MLFTRKQTIHKTSRPKPRILPLAIPNTIYHIEGGLSNDQQHSHKSNTRSTQNWFNTVIKITQNQYRVSLAVLGPIKFLYSAVI